MGELVGDLSWNDLRELLGDGGDGRLDFGNGVFDELSQLRSVVPERESLVSEGFQLLSERRSDGGENALELLGNVE